MFKGFYNLTSGMLTQGRNLDVVSNNMTNVSTAGYKSDRYTASTFQEVMLNRVGNKDKSGIAELGEGSYILASSRLYTDYSQGALEPTGLMLDFAIEGNGFFAVETEEGRAYTRAGNFMLDSEGYLSLPGQGRVLSDNQEPILLMTDKISADNHGGIYIEDGTLVGRLGVFSFPDNDQLARNNQGLFVSNVPPTQVNTTIHWKTLERSNVELIQQMVEMMSSQRALQSAAQLSKMYDELMTKSTTEVGRL